MFSENLKTVRKAKGLSQEELAIRLNVVRQTISKWEKGLSVPDANLLIDISDTFEVPVSKLLGATIENEDSEKHISDIAQQLSRINEQLAIKNRRTRRVWKAIAIIFGSFVAMCFILVLVGMIAVGHYRSVEITIIQSEARLIGPIPAITFDGVVHMSNGTTIDSIGESDITGHILEHMIDWSAENSQESFRHLIGAPYARYGDNIVVQWGGREVWLLFVAS